MKALGSGISATTYSEAGGPWVPAAVPATPILHPSFRSALPDTLVSNGPSATTVEVPRDATLAGKIIAIYFSAVLFDMMIEDCRGAA